MRFRNGKKNIGLIALLSCVFTATVAFAAYTGYNYINGTVTVEGNPFNMVFTTRDGTTLEEGGQIDAETHAIASWEDGEISERVSDLEVSADGTTIDSFTVTLTAVEDMVTYTFALTNTGASTAYLDAVGIGETVLPMDSAGRQVSGLQYNLFIATVDSTGGFAVSSTDGAPVSAAPDGSSTTTSYISVAPGESVSVRLAVIATEPADGTPILFSAYDADTEAYGAEITLGQITITWSAVDPSQA